MKKELKRSIKEDEFVSGVQVVVNWVREHKDEARVSVAVLVVVLVGGALLYQYRSSRIASAEAEFARALEIFHAPLTSELGQGEAPPGPVFPQPAQRYAAAAEAFEKLASAHSSLPVGRRARYYAGLSQLELGELDAAEAQLQTVAGWGNDDPLLATLAKLALGEVQQRSGDLDAAVLTWREVAENADAAVPRDHALMRMARALDLAARYDEAGAAYRQIVERFPDSTYVSEARQRVAYLAAAG